MSWTSWLGKTFYGQHKYNVLKNLYTHAAQVDNYLGRVFHHVSNPRNWNHLKSLGLQTPESIIEFLTTDSPNNPFVFDKKLATIAVESVVEATPFEEHPLYPKLVNERWNKFYWKSFDAFTKTTLFKVTSTIAAISVITPLILYGQEWDFKLDLFKLQTYNYFFDPEQYHGFKRVNILLDAAGITPYEYEISNDHSLIKKIKQINLLFSNDLSELENQCAAFKTGKLDAFLASGFKEEFQVELLKHTHISPYDIILKNGDYLIAEKAYNTGKLQYEDLNEFNNIFQAQALEIYGVTKEEALIIDSSTKYELFKEGLDIHIIEQNNPYHILAFQADKLSPTQIQKADSYSIINCLRQDHVNSENFESECLGESSEENTEL
ncbi:MAG: hypothetical protein RLN62_06960 [Rickettsiales bacterium]